MLLIKTCIFHFDDYTVICFYQSESYQIINTSDTRILFEEICVIVISENVLCTKFHPH